MVFDCQSLPRCRLEVRQIYSYNDPVSHFLKFFFKIPFCTSQYWPWVIFVWVFKLVSNIWVKNCDLHSLLFWKVKVVKKLFLVSFEVSGIKNEISSIPSVQNMKIGLGEFSVSYSKLFLGPKLKICGFAFE